MLSTLLLQIKKLRMQKKYKILLPLLVVFIFSSNLQAQIITAYKDVLLNGKPARLNLKTGEFIFTDSKGNDSIVKAKRPDEDNSLDRLNYHIVKSGEKLLDISEQYGLTLKEIKDANNLKTTLVSVGQKLRVRNFEVLKEENTKDIWVVSKGQTLYSISRKTGVSIKTIKQLNGLKNNTLAIGQKLYLK